MSDRVLVCPTAFKGTLSATEAAQAIAAGVRRALPGARLDVLPLSDGGPGLIEALHAATGGEVSSREVRGPLPGVRAAGRWLRTPEGDAVLESADACGLHLLAAAGPGAPLEAHTIGVGELVRAALEGRPGRVVLGLGGSGTSDGGTGLARVFGYRFLDAAGEELPAGGGALEHLATIRPGERPAGRFVALADVVHPLTGPDGAAPTFAPQKGASPEEVEILARGLERLETRLREDLGVDVSGVPGAGAAGGLGAGCIAFLGARLVPGAEWVLEAVDFDRRLAGARLVITGEGRYDATSGVGKITGAVLRRARAAGAETLLVCGSADDEPEGVRVVEGGGGVLDVVGLAELVAEALRGR